MSTQEDTRVQEIKGKIIKSLLANEESNFDCSTRSDRTLQANPPAFTNSIKEKAIKYGLKNKDRIKKIPGLGAFSKKIYHSILWDNSESNGFTVVNSAQMSLFKKTKLFYKKIPIVGFLTWWVYMFLKMPSKVNELFAEVGELKSTSGLKARGREIFNSDVRDLRDKHDILEKKIGELVAGIDRLKASRVDDAQPKITEFEETIAREIILG